MEEHELAGKRGLQVTREVYRILSLRATAFGPENPVGEQVGRDVLRYQEILISAYRDLDGVFSEDELVLVMGCIRWRTRLHNIPFLVEALPKMVFEVLRVSNMAASFLPVDVTNTELYNKLASLTMAEKAALVDAAEQGRMPPKTIAEMMAEMERMGDLKANLLDAVDFAEVGSPKGIGRGRDTGVPNGDTVGLGADNPAPRPSRKGSEVGKRPLPEGETDMGEAD